MPIAAFPFNYFNNLSLLLIILKLELLVGHNIMKVLPWAKGNYGDISYYFPIFYNSLMICNI